MVISTIDRASQDVIISKIKNIEISDLLQREPVVLDLSLINQAIEFGWGVAFPEWNKKIHDVAEATNKYGRLFTIQSILKSTETNKLKIDLKRKIYG